MAPRSVLVVAHNVHPFPRSAEAIVTGALIDALRRRGHEVVVLTGPAGHVPLDGHETTAVDRCWTVAPSGGLPAWRHLPARTLRGAASRVADRAGVALGREPFPVRAWAVPAAAALLQHLDELPPATVVWGRGLPEASLAAVRRARATRPFPLVCSLGDPLPPPRPGRHGTDAAVARTAVAQVRELAATTDAWTFPSRRVADGVVQLGHLDATRTFVLPHVLPAPRAHATGPDHTSAGLAAAPPTIAYVGSGYRWLLDGPLLPALERAARAGTIRVELALRDLDEAGRARVAALVPDAVVQHDLDPVSAAAVVDRADGLLVPGPDGRLLYTKVVEALRHARPVLTITPVPGTTAELVDEAGGVVVAWPGASAAEVDDALERLARIAAATEDQGGRRRAVADRLSTERTIDGAERILAFAAAHASARASGAPPPAPPTLDRWP